MQPQGHDLDTEVKLNKSSVDKAPGVVGHPMAERPHVRRHLCKHLAVQIVWKPFPGDPKKGPIPVDIPFLIGSTCTMGALFLYVWLRTPPLAAWILHSRYCHGQHAKRPASLDKSQRHRQGGRKPVMGHVKDCLDQFGACWAHGEHWAQAKKTYIGWLKARAGNLQT